jgi:hypothetical protein
MAGFRFGMVLSDSQITTRRRLILHRWAGVNGGEKSIYSTAHLANVYVGQSITA